MVFCRSRSRICRSIHQPVHHPGCPGYRPGGDPLRNGLPGRYVRMLSLSPDRSGYVLRYAAKSQERPYPFTHARRRPAREKTSSTLRHCLSSTAGEKAILVVFVIGYHLPGLRSRNLGMVHGRDRCTVPGNVLDQSRSSTRDLGFNSYAADPRKRYGRCCQAAHLVVGFARGVLVVMTDGNILHTILHCLRRIPSGTAIPWYRAVGMYIFQCLLSFIVPSGSGQASRINADPGSSVRPGRSYPADRMYRLPAGRRYLAYILTPTSGYFMAGLALAKISLGKVVQNGSCRLVGLAVSAWRSLRSCCSGNPAPIIKLKNLTSNNLNRVAGGGSLCQNQTAGISIKLTNRSL